MPGKLTQVGRIYRYFEALAAASDRVGKFRHVNLRDHAFDHNVNLNWNDF